MKVQAQLTDSFFLTKIVSESKKKLKLKLHKSNTIMYFICLIVYLYY